MRGREDDSGSNQNAATVVPDVHHNIGDGTVLVVTPCPDRAPRFTRLFAIPAGALTAASAGDGDDGNHAGANVYSQRRRTWTCHRFSPSLHLSHGFRGRKKRLTQPFEMVNGAGAIFVG
jgi:hypothetical protein